MAKYVPMRTLIEFKQWLDLRRMNLARALNVEPKKIKYTEIQKMIVLSGPITIDDNILRKFAPKIRRRII